jgi:hypothetical protein
VTIPIRLRLTIWYALLLTAIITAVGVFVVLRLRSDLTASIDDRLRPATGQIAAGYHSEGVAEFRDVAATVLSGERAAAQVLDARGRVVLAYGDPVSQAPLLNARELAAVERGQTIDRTARRDAGRIPRRRQAGNAPRTAAGRGRSRIDGAGSVVDRSPRHPAPARVPGRAAADHCRRLVAGPARSAPGRPDDGDR